MSTNALIQVQNSNVILYKHFDGGPASTLPWLMKFHADFLEERGYADEVHETAQLVRSTVLMQEEFDLDPSTATGWGLYDGKLEGDETLEYVLMSDGRIKTAGCFYSLDNEIVFPDGTYTPVKK